jgi:hypothetical protein
MTFCSKDMNSVFSLVSHNSRVVQSVEEIDLFVGVHINLR